MNLPITQDELQKKINELKASGSVDLSTEEDLSLAIMNLVSLEEHFFFTGEKTKKDKYFDMMEQIREMRKSLMTRMMPENEGETWCISKHLLASSMRLMEVGTKLQSSGKNNEARDMFDKSYELYSIFWAIRLKLVDLSNTEQAGSDKDQPWTKEDIVNKLVDCCNENSNPK